MIIKRKLLYSIAIIYCIFLILIVSSIFFPYFSNVETISNQLSNLIIGGYPGFILILFSIKQLYNLHTLRAFAYGSIGCLAIGINIVVIIDLLNSNYPNLYIVLSNSTYLALGMWTGFCIINSALIILYLTRSGFGDDPMVRRTILDLGTKYARLEVKEISEKCKIDRANIIDVIKQMINNKEIFMFLPDYGIKN